MSSIRKIVIVALLILFIGLMRFFSINQIVDFPTNTILAFGYILLAAVTFGELFSYINLPKISGYLLAGIVFGPFSSLIFQTDFFKIFTDSDADNLKFITELALGLVAFLIGSKINLKDLNHQKKTVLLVIFFNVSLVVIGTLLIFLVLAPYIEILKSFSFQVIIIISLIVSLFLTSSSPLVTSGVIEETKSTNKLSRLILNIAVFKEVLIYILFGILILIAALEPSLNEEASFSSILFKSTDGLFLSFFFGLIAGLFLSFYQRLLREDNYLSFLILTSAVYVVCSLISLNIFIVFLTAGLTFINLEKREVNLLQKLENFILLLFLVIFSMAGSAINFNLFKNFILIAVLIFLLRIFLIYLSVEIASKISGVEKEIKNYLWLGLVPQSTLESSSTLLLLTSLSFGGFVGQIILSVSAINILLGPPLLRFVIKVYDKKFKQVAGSGKEKYEDRIREEVVPYKKFNVPQFEDRSLNNLVLSLREKLISHLQEFENTLINKRSEESFEFYYQIVEKYIEEYQKLKNIFTSGILSGKEIKEKVLLTQQEISEWFAQISIQRKTVEQQILNAEFLLQKLFDDLKDYCETAPDYVIVEQEQDKYEKEADDSLLVQSVKSYKRLDKWFRGFVGIKSVLKRKIPYVTLVKYYFEYQIALEMEKVAFLLGLERLNVLKKVKKIYDDVTTNLEELINLIAEHKDVETISLLAIDKLNEIHDRLKQEISSIGEEIEASNQNLRIRLNYAFANPFNQFLKSILKAGTIELNIKKFHFSKIYSETNKAKETTLETIRFWVNYLLGFLGVCERDARIFEITGKINSLINNTMINHSDLITSHIRGLISELNTQLKSLEKEISDKDFLKFENIAEIKNLISKYRDEIIHILNEKGISRLSLLKKSYSVMNIINSLKEQFLSIIKNYEKEIKVLDEQDFELKETRTKYIELKTLHFADIIKIFFENEILQEIIRLNEIVQGHLGSAIFELKNIENVIYYHFNITIDELNKLDTEDNPQRLNEELLRILEDSLKSSIKLLRDKIKVWDRQIEKFESEIELALTEKIYSQISNIKEAFRKELTSELEKKIETPKFQILIQTLIHKQKDIYYRLKKFFARTKEISNKIIKPFIREFREFLEQDLDGKSIIIYLYDQTVYDERVYNSLPFVYRKLFDYTSAEIVEILVGREKEKEILNQAFTRTTKGLSGSTAIIGESGTGKSSLISSFISKLQTDASIYRYNFEKTIRSEKEFLNILSEILGLEYISSYEEIISELNLDPKYKIVILEDIHKIYLRKFGGLEAMKKLLLIISETSNKIFWIVSISYHAWQLLNRILNIGNYFPFQIKTEVLTKEQIKEAILKRHKTSGYNLEFLQDEEFKVHKHLKYLLLSQDKQIILQEEFFNKLYEACEGNITSALFYWIKSIKEFKNDTIYIKPLKKLDFRFLETFEIDKLLTLSNLIQHGSLTIKEHQEIFKCDEEKSKAILNFLNSANLVHFDMNEKGEKVFYINSAIYKPVEIELRKLHIFD